MNVKDYFSFTRGEKRGSVALLIIIIALIVANFSIDFFKSTQQTDFSHFENEINAFEKELNNRKNNIQGGDAQFESFEFNPNTISDDEWKRLGFKPWQIKTINNYKEKGGYWRSKTDVSKIYGLTESHFKQLKPFILLPNKALKKNIYVAKKEAEKIEYFNFNPNTISKNQWKQLGFAAWQIKTIFNYKSKGGSWKTKQDVKKIYGLGESNYNKLEPFILLPENAGNNIYATNKKEYNAKVNINTADAKELTLLKGINSEKYAAIIIKYRNSLGGFIKKEQLKEIWNLKEEIYNGFINQIVLENNNPIQLNINTATTAILMSHPYINWKTANAIVKYRKSNGIFTLVEDIKKIHLINNETYLKIAPYLNIK